MELLNGKHPQILVRLQFPYFWKPQKVAILVQRQQNPIKYCKCGFASFTSYLQRKFHLVFQQLSVVNQHQAMSGNAQNG